MAFGLGAVLPASGRTAVEIHKLDQASFAPVPDTPVFVLVIGNDAKGGDTSSDGDALHVIGINASAGKATILNIPRDSWVPIPGAKLDKINSAYRRGGAVLEAKAVGDLVGINISMVLSTGFQGFSDMVDELGGITVNVPVAMDDKISGAIFPAGPVHMDGGAALAFARNRHLVGNDFTRTQDQGILILTALAQLRASQPAIANTLKWMAVLARHTTLDGVGLGDLYRLGRLALSIDPANVRNVTMPGTGGMVGALSVVFVDPAAQSLFADFRDDAILESN
ncbi:MAG: LCP family protein [Actinomycetota bacterium]|nr:LCP family protein [Actinomycetota bacterium]